MESRTTFSDIFPLMESLWKKHDWMKCHNNKKHGERTSFLMDFEPYFKKMQKKPEAKSTKKENNMMEKFGL